MPTKARPFPRPTLGFLLAVLLGLGPAALAQQASFRDTTSVVLVEVPVNVTRDGKTVHGLSKDHFTILDEGRPQEIIGFDVIDLAALETDAGVPRRVPMPVRRHFLFLFDLSFSRPDSILRARWAARDLLATFHPTDLVGVGIYSAATGGQFLLGFTTDRGQVELALETLAAPTLIERTPDPLSLYLGELNRSGILGLAARDQEADQGWGGGMKQIADDAVFALLDQMSEQMARVAGINRVIPMLRDLGSMAEAMAGVEGRKHVVLLSEGFEDRWLFGGRAGDVDDQTLDQYSQWLSSTDRVYGSTRLQNDLAEMIERFRRADCTIQAVDVGGLRVNHAMRQRRASQAGLFSMASDTGGELYGNFNDLDAAMRQMLERNSVTYLLTFRPETEHDGRFHRLKVKLRDVPRGTRAHHRMGYFAPRPFSETGAGQRRLSAAELILRGEDLGAIAAHVLVTPFPVTGEDAFVPVLVEVDGGDLVGDLAGGEVPVKLYVYALDAAGEVRDFATQSLSLDLQQVGTALAASGLKFWAHVDLPPGGYSMRVLVRNEQTGELALREVPVTVFSGASEAGFLLPPLFPEAPGKWVLIREDPSRHRDLPYPFMAGEEPYVPAAGPVVPRRGSVTVYLTGAGFGSGRRALAGQVTDENQTPVGGARLEIEGRLPASGALATVRARLKTAGLEPGIYTLRVTADAAGRALSSATRFRVE